jgi:hypothetical protein
VELAFFSFFFFVCFFPPKKRGGFPKKGAIANNRLQLFSLHQEGFSFFLIFWYFYLQLQQQQKSAPGKRDKYSQEI